MSFGIILLAALGWSILISIVGLCARDSYIGREKPRAVLPPARVVNEKGR